MTTNAAKLRFKKSIVSSPKESIPLKELQSRLDSLATELSKVDQEDFNTKSLDKYKDDLISKKLIHHKDLGVQSLVACCLSDILRIYAPDAPYTDSQLADIFKLFIKQFQRLADADNAYYTQQVYLLTRSAEVRSIILVTDISDSAQLIETIFELFYDSSKSFHKKLEPIISDILIEIVSEWDHITTTVLKLILNKFLTHDDSSVSSSLPSSKASPFNFTLAICNANPDRLARYLTKFFSEVLIECNDEKSEDSFKSLVKIHRLTVEIWKHVPEILGSVMGLIDNELSADDYKIRVLATDTIGKILSINSRISFVQVHKPTWITWMKKTLDISPAVRTKWVEQASGILSNRNDLNQEIVNGLSKTLIDADEKVRLATITAIGSLPAEVVLEKLSEEEILSSVSQLTREKHPLIREEAIKILGALFNESYHLLESTDSSEYDAPLKIVSNIPSHILNLYYINDKNINYLVDLVLLESILPPNEDEIERVKRLIFVFNDLDSKAKASFIAFNKRQQQLSGVLKKLLEFAEEANGGNNSDLELSSKIGKTINWLAVTIPDQFSPVDSLKRFMAINNRRLYYLLNIIISDESDYKSLKNSTKEFLNRVQDPKIVNNVKGESSFPVKNILSTFKVLIFRASQTVFNRSNISPLLKLSQVDSFSKTAQELIDNISSISPTSFQHQISQLVKIIEESTPGVGSSNAHTLRTIFHIVKKLTNLLDNSNLKFFDKLIEFGKVGNVSEAKYAVKILSLADKKDIFLTGLFEEIYPLDKMSEHLASHLAVISQLFLVAPYMPEEKTSELTPFLIKNLLLSNIVVGKDDDPSWIEDEKLEDPEYSPLASKLYAVKIFTNSLRVLSESESEDEETSRSTTENVLKLLSSLIGNGGEIVNPSSETYPTPKHFQSRLRLDAGLQVLKLARFPKYNKIIKPQLIERLVLLIQDETQEVRLGFVNKLTEYLKNQEISFKFLPLVYMIAYEPLESLKSDTKTWIKSTFHKFSKSGFGELGKSEIVFEKSLAGLIYIIAHHSEFLDYISATEDAEENTLKAYSFSLEYITFFLDSVANEQNISLLYYLATRVKQYRDASFEDKDYNGGNDSVTHIYKVADLTQLAIKELQDHKSWILSSYPGKLELSSELYRPMKSIKESQSVLSENYIDSGVLKKLRQIVKHKVGSIVHVKRVRGAASANVPKSKKPKVEVVAKTHKQYKKRAAVDDDDDARDATFRGSSTGKENIDPGNLRKSSRLKRISYAQGSDHEEEEDHVVDVDDDSSEDDEDDIE